MISKISRRTLLRGGAGVAIALPWLEIFGQRAARAAAASDPTRLLVVFHGNGVNVDDWFPATEGPGYELPESLSPLAAFQDRMIVTRGIDGLSAKDQNGNPHTKGAPHLLTGAPHIPGQFSRGGGGGFASDISFDQEVARHIRGATPIPALVMGPKADEGAVGETPRARISYTGYNEPVTPEHRPQAVFDQLTRQFTGASDPDLTAEEAERIRQQRRSVLDFVMEDVENLQRRLGAKDRERLEEYLTQLREIEATIPAEGTPPEERACEPPSPLDPIGNVKDDAELPAVTRQMMGLARLALQCDLTRVVTYQWQGAQSPINYSRVSDPILSGVRNHNHHGISHDGPFSDITKICKWHSAELARLCGDLDEVEESDGRSLLDNTLVLYCNELSDGERHSFDDLPFVIIGASGRLQSGRYVRFDGASNNDLFVTLFEAFGIDKSSFGDPRYNRGPLSGILA